jgi:hypothetical protein
MAKKQVQSKTEMLKQTVIKAVQQFLTKEGGITFADIEALFGRNSEFMAALCATMKISF